jgi:hypothetical protein
MTKPAFPRPTGLRNSRREWEGPIESEPGMTYREWAAGLAMQGVLAAAERTGVAEGRYPDKEVAKVSVRFADALIAELAKGKR